MKGTARRGGGRPLKGSEHALRRSHRIEIGDTHAPLKVARPRLRRTVMTILKSLGRPRHGVSLTLVGDRTIRGLNHRYLGKSLATDVLAFSMEGLPSLSASLPAPLLGEVIVSVETAKRQAREHGHSLHEELDLLITHGLLHLVGYDDEDPLEARLMHEREMAILGRIYARPSPSLRVGPVRQSQHSGNEERQA